MADFDPDAYLANTPPPAVRGFDPDAYLAAGSPAAPPAGKPAWYERVANGLAQQGRAFRTAVSGIAEPAATLATGALAIPLSAAAGVAGNIYSDVTGSPPIGNEVQRDVMGALTYVPRTEAGQAVLGAIGHGIDVAKVPPFIPSLGSGPVVRGAINSAEQLETRAATIGKPTPAETAAALMAVRGNPNLLDAAVTARRTGLTISPSTVNPSLKNRTGTALVGPSDMANSAMKRNEAVLQDIARKDVGIPEGVPLNEASYQQVRDVAATPYDEIRAIRSFTPDTQFSADLTAMNDFSKHSPAVQDFLKKAEPQLHADLRDMAAGGFNGDDVVKLMRKFRQEANQVLSSHVQRSPEELALAEVKRSAAKAIEGLVDRSLVQAEAAAPGQGFGDLADRFREGRRTIAKTHTWQKFTDEQTGKIDALGIANMSAKPTNFTGGLADVAQVAANFKNDFTPTNGLGIGVGNLAYHGGRINSVIDILSSPIKNRMLSPEYQAKNLVGLDPRPLREQMGYGQSVTAAPEPLTLAPTGEMILPPSVPGAPPKLRDILTLAGDQQSVPTPVTGGIDFPLQGRAVPLYQRGVPTQEGPGLSSPDFYRMPEVQPLPPEVRPTMTLADMLPKEKPSSPQPGVPFDLRQEVMQQLEPEINAFRQTEADLIQKVSGSSGFWRNKYQSELDALRQEFAAGMDLLGAQDAAGAHGLNRLLYDAKSKSGNAPQLQIDHTFDPRKK